MIISNWKLYLFRLNQNLVLASDDLVPGYSGVVLNHGCTEFGIFRIWNPGWSFRPFKPFQLL